MSGAPGMEGSLASVDDCVAEVAVEAARRVCVLEEVWTGFVAGPRVWRRLVCVLNWQSMHASR
jgi:hypothetical protein